MFLKITKHHAHVQITELQLTWLRKAAGRYRRKVAVGIRMTARRGDPKMGLAWPG